MSTNAVLRELRPDTQYTVTLVPVYAELEGRRSSEDGKTSESPGGGEAAGLSVRLIDTR